MARVSAPDFWQDLYTRGGDGWELGGPAPTLVEFVEATPPPRGRVAVPGCGRGHDGRLWRRLGYRVFCFDFVAEVAQEARRLAERDGVALTVEARDVFTLDRDYAGFFDGVWEYTCFCAIDPARRPEYVRLLQRILKPGGWLLACFFPIRAGSSSGPPFATTEGEVRELLAPGFTLVETYTPAASAPGRQGLEWVVLARLDEGAREA